MITQLMGFKSRCKAPEALTKTYMHSSVQFEMFSLEEMDRTGLWYDGLGSCMCHTVTLFRGGSTTFWLGGRVVGTTSQCTDNAKDMKEMTIRDWYKCTCQVVGGRYLRRKF